jgi:diguanylate cyclase (GGDEF)-like protein
MSDDKPTVTFGGPTEPDDALTEDAVRAGLPLMTAVSAFAVTGAGAAGALTGVSAVAVTAMGVTAGLLVALAVLAWVRPDLVPIPEVLAVVVALAPAGAGVAGLVLTDDVQWSLGVLVALSLVGAGVLSTRWVVAAVYTVWVGWLAGLAAANLVEWPTGWLGAGVAVTAAGVLASVSRRRLAEQLAELSDSAAQASVRDPLTGLVNRKGLSMMGQQIVETARRSGDAVHCVYVDIDQLRHVNEVAGEEAGDDVVVAISDALRSVTRATDIVARWGGDEFCVIGPGPGMSPMELERRLRERVLLNPPVPLDVWEPKVCAGGAMLAPWDSGTLDTLLGKADQEMYLRRALRRGGPRSRAQLAAEEEQQPNS